MKAGSRVKSLMSEPKVNPSDMTRKTFYLNGKAYKVFEKICKAHGRSTSEMVDALINDFINEFSPTEKINKT